MRGAPATGGWPVRAPIGNSRYGCVAGKVAYTAHEPETVVPIRPHAPSNTGPVVQNHCHADRRVDAVPHPLHDNVPYGNTPNPHATVHRLAGMKVLQPSPPVDTAQWRRQNDPDPPATFRRTR